MRFAFQFLGSVAVLMVKFLSAESDSKANFLSKYHQFLPTCSVPKINNVMSRHDRLNMDLPPERPWSINEKTYTQGEGQSYCDSLTSLTASLQFGHRERLNASLTKPTASDTKGNDPIDYRSQSFFVPSKCNYKWFSAAELCSIMNKFSLVFLMGNSLLRHETQGMLMLLTDDWTRGALPGFDVSSDIFRKCICDGQFSEHLICRPYSHNGLIVRPSHSLQHNGSKLCEGPAPLSSASPQATAKGPFPSFDLLYQASQHTSHQACPTHGDDRPRVFYLQGGAKWEDKQAEFIPFLRSMLANVDSYRERCKDSKAKYHVIFSGLTSQAPFMDARFPRQARKEVQPFSEMISHHLNRSDAPYKVTELNFLELTNGAQTSDGFHSMSDVNAVEAMYFFNVLDFLA